MRRTRFTSVVLRAAALAAAAGLAACSTDTAPSSDAAAPETAATSSPAVAAPPSGIAGVYQYSTNTFGLRVYDPASGGVLYDGLLPDDRWLSLNFVMDSSAPAGRVGFSPDRRFMYSTGGDRGCALVLLQGGAPTGYPAHPPVPPPTTFSSSGTCFGQAHYEDGKLVATVKESQDQAAQKNRYVIDPANPT